MQDPLPKLHESIGYGGSGEVTGMIQWSSHVPIYLHRDPVDFRKAINGLAVIVSEAMASSGHANTMAQPLPSVMNNGVGYYEVLISVA